MTRIEQESMKIAGIYGLVSAAYIIASNRLVYVFVKDPNRMSWINTAKGFGFVAVTCALLYFLVRNLMLEQLRAQERAWAAQKFDALGRMAAGVAHDFNNILQVTAGVSQLGVESAKDRPELADLFAQAQLASQRGRDLVRHLLAFARQEPSRPSLVQAGEVVASMERLLRSVVRPPVTLKVEVRDGAGWLLVDRVQMEQVLMNLVVNAVDSMPLGGTLTVRVLRAGGQVELDVQDTGSGIPSEILPHIFEPFFTTKGGQGNGLGLATVHGIVRQWGGSIEVQSRPELGSRFRVLVPAAEPPAA